MGHPFHLRDTILSALKSLETETFRKISGTVRFFPFPQDNANKYYAAGMSE